jgi:hypothetical protein
MADGTVFALVAALHVPGVLLFAALLVHLARSTPDEPSGGADGGPPAGGPWRWSRREPRGGSGRRAASRRARPARR